MMHPFEKLLYRKLGKSTVEDNLVLKAAQKIIDKGYPEKEIIDILERLKKGLIEPKDHDVIVDALEELTEEEW